MASILYYQSGDDDNTILRKLLENQAQVIAGNLSFSAAGTVAAASSVTIGITDDTTTNATMYPLWVTANTGNLPAKVTSTKLSFNPSSGLLLSTRFESTVATGTAPFTVASTTQVANLNAATAGVASAVAVGGITGLGTGVGAALAVNVGSAGAPVLFNGAGGTPISLVLTNATGYPGTSALVTVGALNSGSITSGFGSIDVGANSITGGAISGTTGTFSGIITNTSSTDYQPQYDQTHVGNTAGSASYLVMKRARAGTTAVQSGDFLGSILAQAYANGAYNDAASFTFRAIGAPVGSNVPTSLTIAINGGSGMVEALTFNASGGNGAWGQTTAAAGSFTTLAASGNVSTSADLRLGFSYSRVATPINSGEWLGGYNLYYNANVVRDSLGAAAGAAYGPSGILFFAATSGAAGAVVAEVGRFTPTGLAVTGTLGASGNVWSGNNGFALNSGTTDGWYATSNGSSVASADGVPPFYLRRRTTDGTLAEFYRDTSIVGSISVTTTATAYNTSSDARLKTNVRNLTGSGAIIDALRPVIHDWKIGQSPNTYGFIAQEAYKVFPQSVTKGDDDAETITQQWTMDNAKLVPVLLAELQLLRARVAALENK